MPLKRDASWTTFNIHAPRHYHKTTFEFDLIKRRDPPIISFRWTGFAKMNRRVWKYESRLKRITLLQRFWIYTYTTIQKYLITCYTYIYIYIYIHYRPKVCDHLLHVRLIIEKIEYKLTQIVDYCLSSSNFYSFMSILGTTFILFEVTEYLMNLNSARPRSNFNNYVWNVVLSLSAIITYFFHYS